MPCRERHPRKPEPCLLNRNTAFADVDLDARGLLPLLTELIARDDDERADHEVRFNGFLVYCSAKRNDSHRLLRYEGAAAQWSGRPDFLPNV